ncbi:hypothetical protein [Chamaesiphon sp. VAR_48_metabat_403]|uniref:hypothetical protein n=1 Tax=Chamaesiphon sp. VAR_48_metabat_403 TaxID=2964700 RepID=UPI00286DB984|nr:hypothetical protein [Chamaesiphon sp. VAR_48_metabat_403]
MIKTDETVCDRSTWIKTECPHCNSPDAIMKDPDLSESGRFISGTCDACEGYFEYDLWDCDD